MLLSGLCVAMVAACEPGIDHGDALPAQAELKIAPGRHCAHCGWIESKREIVASIVDPLAVRVFQETLPAGWRPGERVGVIEGR